MIFFNEVFLENYIRLFFKYKYILHPNKSQVYFKVILAAIAWLSPKTFADHTPVGYSFVCGPAYCLYGHPELRLNIANSEAGVSPQLEQGCRTSPGTKQLLAHLAAKSSTHMVSTVQLHI